MDKKTAFTNFIWTPFDSKKKEEEEARHYCQLTWFDAALMNATFAVVVIAFIESPVPKITL